MPRWSFKLNTFKARQAPRLFLAVVVYSTFALYVIIGVYWTHKKAKEHREYALDNFGDNQVRQYCCLGSGNSRTGQHSPRGVPALAMPITHQERIKEKPRARMTGGSK